MYIKGILAFISSKARTVVPVLFFCTTIMLLPEKYMDLLGLLSFRNEYKGIIGAAWVLSFCILLYIGLETSYKYVKGKVKFRNFVIKMTKQIVSLEDSQKEILKKMYKNIGYSLRFDITDGKHSYLEGLSLIGKAADFSYPGPVGKIMYAYTLQPWVVELIKKNPDILD